MIFKPTTKLLDFIIYANNANMIYHLIVYFIDKYDIKSFKYLIHHTKKYSNVLHIVLTRYGRNTCIRLYELQVREILFIIVEEFKDKLTLDAVNNVICSEEWYMMSDYGYYRLYDAINYIVFNMNSVSNMRNSSTKTLTKLLKIAIEYKAPNVLINKLTDALKLHENFDINEINNITPIADTYNQISLFEDDI